MAVLALTDWTSFVFFKLIAALHEKRGSDTDYNSQTAVCTNRQAINIWARRGRFSASERYRRDGVVAACSDSLPAC